MLLDALIAFAHVIETIVFAALTVFVAAMCLIAVAIVSVWRNEK